MEETKMIRRRKLAAAISAAAVGSLLFAGMTGVAANAAAPSWCGPKKITVGMTHGNGGNNWRAVNVGAAQLELAKCKSVTKVTYKDGQGSTTKAISDIKSLVATGVKALIVFPDAGKAILPTLRAAYKAGVVTVPYRVDPGGKAGTDYSVYIPGDFVTDGKAWGNWTKKNFPNGANILFLSGPAGNSQGLDERKGFESVLGDGSGKYKYIGNQPFEVTNWEAPLTQTVLTAAIAKYDKIDVIMSDFGPVMVSSLGEFTKSGRSIPALATSDGNILGCFFQDNVKKNKDFKLMTVATGTDHVVLAVQHAVARATGGKIPTATQFKAPVFEDSTTSKPRGVQCDREIGDWTFLSSQMSGKQQEVFLNK
jgi:ribose transport system substrate-binding protein